MDELGCELGVIVLLDVVDASIVADVEQTILLVEFPISAQAFTQAVRVRAAQNFEEQVDVLGLLQAFLGGFLLHVEELGQTILNLRTQMSSVCLKGRKPILASIVQFLNSLKSRIRVEQQNLPHLLVKLPLEVVN